MSLNVIVNEFLKPNFQLFVASVYKYNKICVYELYILLFAKFTY